MCMTKGNATTKTPLKGGARLANVSTTSDESVNVSTTSDESVKRKIRQKVYYARGGDFTRKEKLEMLRSQCARGESVLIFVATESKAFLLEDVLLSIQFDVVSIAGSAEDIPTVDIVVSYDMPDTIDEYECRIGEGDAGGSVLVPRRRPRGIADRLPRGPQGRRRSRPLTVQ